MNCPECGSPVVESDRLCPRCCARIERPSLWRRFLSLFRGEAKRGRPVVNLKKSVTIKTVGASGEKHEYHSLAEVPPEIRSEIEALEAEAKQGKDNELSFMETSQGQDVFRSKFIRRQSVSTYKITDPSGAERIYHSLEEMPPELRAAIERATKKLE